MSGKDFCSREHADAGVLFSFPLVADRRFCVQAVNGGGDRFRLWIDTDLGGFFVPLSKLRDLFDDRGGRGMSSGSVSGSTFHNGWVIRGSVQHKEYDRRAHKAARCEGHDVQIVITRAMRVEIESRFAELQARMEQTFENEKFPWEPFPRRADLILIEEALRARGVLGGQELGPAPSFDRDSLLESLPQDDAPEDSGDDDDDDGEEIEVVRAEDELEKVTQPELPPTRPTRLCGVHPVQGDDAEARKARVEEVRRDLIERGIIVKPAQENTEKTPKKE